MPYPHRMTLGHRRPERRWALQTHGTAEMSALILLARTLLVELMLIPTEIVDVYLRSTIAPVALNSACRLYIDIDVRMFACVSN